MRMFTKIAAFGFAIAAFACLALTGATPASAELAMHPTLGQIDLGTSGLMFAGAGIVINNANLANLGVGFKSLFQGGLGQAESMYSQVATMVNSTTGKEEYGWLGKIPGMREWLGDRVVHGIQNHGYEIKNKDFELTVSVGRNDIEDDNLGVYSPLFTELGRSAGAHPDELVFSLLLAGFSTTCYDDQYFFDTDHPVLDADGNTVSVANTDGGAGEPWFLVDDSRAVKPIIYQQRQAPKFVALDNPDDPNVFKRKEFVYGVDYRGNVGFGFWQFAWGSKQTLDAAHYATARAGLGGMKGDYGRPLGIKGRKLIVGPANEAAARTVVGTQELAGGGTNPWFNTAEVVVIPWLA